MSSGMVLSPPGPPGPPGWPGAGRRKRPLMEARDYSAGAGGLCEFGLWIADIGLGSGPRTDVVFRERAFRNRKSKSGPTGYSSRAPATRYGHAEATVRAAASASSHGAPGAPTMVAAMATLVTTVLSLPGQPAPSVTPCTAA